MESQGKSEVIEGLAISVGSAILISLVDLGFQYFKKRGIVKRKRVKKNTQKV